MLTDEQKKIKTIFTQFFNENGRVYKIEELRADPNLPSDYAVLKAFNTNSYSRALKAMNLPVNKNAVYTKEEVGEYMKQFVEKFGEEQLTHKNFEEWMVSNYLSTSWRKKYGWNQLKKELNLMVLKETDYDPETVYSSVLEAVNNHIKLLDEIPTTDQIDDALKPLCLSTVQNITGKTYREILQENGIDLRPYSYSKEYLLDSLKKEYKEKGYTPLAQNFRNLELKFNDGSFKPSYSCYVNAFGSFTEALKQAGFKPNTRGDGNSYISNHNHTHPSIFQGEVDDFLQFVPHNESDHGRLYSTIPGFEHYNGAKDADFVLFNIPGLDTDYIIEATSYLTREQFLGNAPIPEKGRQMKYFKDLQDKVDIVNSSNFKGEFIIIFKDDNIEGLLKPILSKFPPKNAYGKPDKKRPINRSRNPELYSDEELVNNLEVMAKKIAIYNNGRPPFRKEMYQPDKNWPHPSIYFKRFPVKTWDELLSFVGLENHKEYRTRELFSEYKREEVRLGKLPRYSLINSKLYKKALFKFGTWSTFIQAYTKFTKERKL